jgi:hypothetical protein
MYAAQLRTLDPAPCEEPLHARLVRARFEALAEWGMSPADARAIAQAVNVDIVEVVGLLRHGCPAPMVLAILA